MNDKHYLYFIQKVKARTSISFFSLHISSICLAFPFPWNKPKGVFLKRAQMSSLFKVQCVTKIWIGEWCQDFLDGIYTNTLIVITVIINLVHSALLQIWSSLSINCQCIRRAPILSPISTNCEGCILDSMVCGYYVSTGRLRIFQTMQNITIQVQVHADKGWAHSGSFHHGLRTFKCDSTLTPLTRSWFPD